MELFLLELSSKKFFYFVPVDKLFIDANRQLYLKIKEFKGVSGEKFNAIEIGTGSGHLAYFSHDSIVFQFLCSYFFFVKAINDYQPSLTR